MTSPTNKGPHIPAVTIPSSGPLGKEKQLGEVELNTIPKTPTYHDVPAILDNMKKQEEREGSLAPALKSLQGALFTKLLSKDLSGLESSLSAVQAEYKISQESATAAIGNFKEDPDFDKIKIPFKEEIEQLRNKYNHLENVSDAPKTLFDGRLTTSHFRAATIKNKNNSCSSFISFCASDGKSAREYCCEFKGEIPPENREKIMKATIAKTMLVDRGFVLSRPPRRVDPSELPSTDPTTSRKPRKGGGSTLLLLGL